MFFWKFTRSGKFSFEYISLIFDFHDSLIKDGLLELSFDECKDMLYLIHDVESLNGEKNHSSGLEKTAFQKWVNMLGYKSTNNYNYKRYDRGLVLGQMTLGNHFGSPIDYGISNKNGKIVKLNTDNLKISMNIDAKTGMIYGVEDKLKAYRDNPYFIDEGYYFDLMPMHKCIIEIVDKMMEVDSDETISFLLNELKWERI